VMVMVMVMVMVWLDWIDQYDGACQFFLQTGNSNCNYKLFLLYGE